jgi:hypothetical protein
MGMLAGALEFGAEASSGAVAQHAARVTARYPHLRERLLHGTGFLSLYAIERPADSPVIPLWSGDGGKQFWLIGDVNYFPQSASASRSKIMGLSELLSARLPGRWLAVEVEPTSRIVRFATDRLGLAWLYIARTRNGYVFSSDFAAVAEALGRALTVDYDTVLLELALGHAPDERTIFNEITLAPPGAVIELGPSGVVTVSEAPIRYGDRLVGRSTDGKFDQLDAIFDAIVRRSMPALESGLMVSISAGYDSRYALAFLHKHAIPAGLFTFGARASEEVDGAESVCARIGQSTRLFSPGEGDWDQWQRCIQQLGNSGMIQWSGWAESWLSFLRAHGRYGVIGYLGDALTGKHLGQGEHTAAGWLRFWQQWSTEGGWAESPLLTPGARHRLRDCLAGRLEQAASRASYALPHQRALHLDLYGRQRRWVAGQPNLISRFVTPVLFFYDDDLIDFWTNLPAEDLFQQRLYLAYAQSRFPRLFPRGEGQSPTLARRALRSAVRRVRAILTGDRQADKPKVIDHDPIIIPNRERILDLAGRVSPLIGEIIDVEAFGEQVRRYGRSQTVPSSHIMKAANVLMLLDLCT